MNFGGGAPYSFSPTSLTTPLNVSNAPLHTPHSSRLFLSIYIKSIYIIFGLLFELFLHFSCELNFTSWWIYNPWGSKKCVIFPHGSLDENTQSSSVTWQELQYIQWVKTQPQRRTTTACDMDRVDQKWQQLSKTAGGKEAKPPTTFNEIKCRHKKT